MATHNWQMTNAQVTGIILTIGGERKELTLDQARALRDELNRVFGEPQPIPHWWPPYQFWPSPKEWIGVPSIDTKPATIDMTPQVTWCMKQEMD